MTRRKSMLAWNKATFALAVVGAVVLVEVIGYVVMMALGVEVPAEYISLIYTTITVLAGVAGSQWINGKTAEVSK